MFVCRLIAGSPDAVLESHILQEYSSSSQESGDGEKKEEVVDDGQGRLTEEEEKEAGVVRMHVYKSYWAAVGSCLAPMVLLALALMQGAIYTYVSLSSVSDQMFFCSGSRKVSDWWLSYWIKETTSQRTTFSNITNNTQYV